MKKMRIAIIGATGFIGSNLAKHISSQNSFSNSLSLITRNQADHLDFHKIKKSIDGTDVIFHAAGLALQHPAIATNKQELLIEEIMQNSVSALVISQALERKQKLIWTSTNAVDIFLSRLSTTDSRKLEEFTDILLANINPQKMSLLEIRLVILKATNNCAKEFKNNIQNFSYPFSKYLGQRVLEKKSRRNIKVIKISDVYGPGQDISERVINPHIPARRIQRFVVAYKLISEGRTKWIPKEGKRLHGFFKQRNGKIVQEVRTDFVFPTYVEDVCKMMIRAADFKSRKKLFEVSGTKMSNYDMACTVRDLFGVEVEIRKIGNHSEIPENSQDLKFFGMVGRLTSFKEGLEKWSAESFGMFMNS